MTTSTDSIKKWEYRIVTLEAEQETRANELGEEGWELAGIFSENGSSKAIFKRVKRKLIG